MPSSVRSGPWLPFVVALSAMGVGVSVARADVILHEYFRPDPSQDLEFGATTVDGKMSAAIQTQSGAVSAPSSETADSTEHVYGGDRSGPGGSEELDKDTTQPSVVHYEDPFTPEIMPFKREQAFDSVSSDFRLVVAGTSLEKLEIGGTARPEEDQFYADLRVDLARGQPVRIPTVGPGARALALRTDPPTAVELFQDSADNWFLKASETRRVRLTMQLSIDRSVFGSQFDKVAWSRLAGHVPSLPPAVRQRASRVAEGIGVSTDMSPSVALEKMVEYFRDFAPSGDRPTSEGGALYEEIALSKKGVCRHRAFSFVVTALGLGLPARLVRNEAHAWVEVFDARIWHRIDLGGAAGRVESELGDRPSHVTPRDPYRWPPGSESGAAMAERARERSGGAGGGRRTQGSDPQGSSVPSVAPEPRQDEDEHRAPAEVDLRLGSGEVLRGGTLVVAGRVTADGESCSRVRVDFELRPRAPSGQTAPLRLGTLFTGPEGRYEHQVIVPYGIPVGDYDVVARTPGDATCGSGQSP